jgi:hypothetical protein
MLFTIEILIEKRADAMNDHKNATPEPQPPVIAAIRYLLRPLIRLLLSHGISFQVFCELAKSVYVKVAEEEFRLASKPQTDSRISLLTGIHRREINRLRNELVTEINLSQHASMSALLLTIWSGHPDYLDDQASPVPLPRLAKKKVTAYPLNPWSNLSAKISAHVLFWMNGYAKASSRWMRMTG